MQKSKSLVLVAVFLTVQLVPYLVAAFSSGPDFVFGGFLLNPIDGNSYLAKMQEGYLGDWLFTLPYTSQTGQGEFLFAFYILLGHLARWSGLSLILIYHLARIVAAGWMAWELIQFSRLVFPAGRRSNWVLILLLFGSGLGWAAAMTGRVTSDFWVAEAFPFLAAYVNPHFPLGLALLLWIIRQTVQPEGKYLPARLFIAGCLLAVIMPFGVVVGAVITAGWAVWVWMDTRTIRWLQAFWWLLGVIPLLFYQYVSVVSHPVLSLWNQQNLTPAPALWDFVVSFSPVILLAAAGLLPAWRNRSRPVMKVLLIWFVLGLVLAYLPFSLQRRFLFGFFIPCVFLAAVAVEDWRQARKNRLRWVVPALIGISIPTNLLILASGFVAAQAHPPALYLSRAEAEVMTWIAENSPRSAVILCSPDTGLFIPARTGRRVLYGHPFETVHADEQGALVESFFQGNGRITPEQSQALLASVDYIFYGPKEKALMSSTVEPDCPVVFESGGVRLCSLP